MENSIMIAITETKAMLKGKEGESIEDRLSFAMSKTLNHWLVIDEDGQFRAAVGAVLLTATDDEKERISTELRSLKALSSALSGVPVDFSQLEVGKTEPIGLSNLWRKVKSTSRERS